ncbi:cupin domain-containing protein [Leekyejoonella antrihumi]|uniref:Cupin domain-containing protein n=1 Tax=Leekyejoonella antrihumi TaxID=1660198 RepID=A0A563DTP9_9MICO|nr:cupin domain-containing protein [Leekyejoonella antrihumi]TWP33302.1 cupin domain-containing protein [Leekyejoonella antrihumi]
MPHLPSTSVHTFQRHGVTFHSYASSATGASRLAAWRADFSPNTPGRLHTMSDEEVLHVLDGALDVEIDEAHFVARTGDAVLVPRGASLRVSNNTTQPARAWVTTALGMTATMSGSAQPISPPWAQ